MQSVGPYTGFTMVELMIVIAIIGLISAVALPSYQSHVNKASMDSAVADINSISLVIDDYMLTNNALPASLTTVGFGSMRDPWGNPYQYINHATEPPGKRRKDKNLVPINTDYNLYSSGEDGRSVAPLTAKRSRDDIVRANNGNYVGLAEKY